MWRHQFPPKLCVLIYNAGVSKHVKGKGKGKGELSKTPITNK